MALNPLERDLAFGGGAAQRFQNILAGDDADQSMAFLDHRQTLGAYFHQFCSSRLSGSCGATVTGSRVITVSTVCSMMSS